MSPRPSEALPGFQLATPRDSTFDSRARPHGRAAAYKACRTEAAAAAGRGESGARSVRWFAQCQILVSLAIRLVSRPSPIAALPRRSVPSQSPCSSNLLIKCLPTLLSVLPICCSLSTGVSIGFALVDRRLPLRRNASRAQGHRRPPGRSPPAGTFSASWRRRSPCVRAFCPAAGATSGSRLQVCASSPPGKFLGSVERLCNFLDCLLVLRGRAPLDTCELRFSHWRTAASITQFVQRLEPLVENWFRHALVCKAQVLSLYARNSEWIRLYKMLPLNSQHLTRLELGSIAVDNCFRNFSNCPSLEHLKFESCCFGSYDFGSFSHSHLCPKSGFAASR